MSYSWSHPACRLFDPLLPRGTAHGSFHPVCAVTGVAFRCRDACSRTLEVAVFTLVPQGRRLSREGQVSGFGSLRSGELSMAFRPNPGLLPANPHHAVLPVTEEHVTSEHDLSLVFCLGGTCHSVSSTCPFTTLSSERRTPAVSMCHPQTRGDENQ